MNKHFDAVSYAVDIAKELVAAFETASRATAPGLVGGVRELPVRRKLEHLLPSGSAVGSA